MTNITDSHLTNIINSDLSRNSFSGSAKVAPVTLIFQKMIEKIEKIIDQLAFQIFLQKFLKNL